MQKSTRNGAARNKQDQFLCLHAWRETSEKDRYNAYLSSIKFICCLTQTDLFFFTIPHVYVYTLDNIPGR